MNQKLPAMQFYPGDWRRDPGVQALDYHDRGIWFELLCIMHDSDDRGRLTLNGKAMSDAAIARILGMPEAEWKQTRSRLEDYGVASVCKETGALMNRRMARDEDLRRKRAEAGAKGGRASRPPKSTTRGSKNGSESEAEGGSSVSSSTSVAAAAVEKDAAVDAPDPDLVTWLGGDGGGLQDFRTRSDYQPDQERVIHRLLVTGGNAEGYWRTSDGSRVPTPERPPLLSQALSEFAASNSRYSPRGVAGFLRKVIENRADPGGVGTSDDDWSLEEHYRRAS